MGQARELCYGLLTKLCFILWFGKARAFRQTAYQVDLMEKTSDWPQHALLPVDSVIAGLWFTLPSALEPWVNLCLARRSQTQLLT